MGKYLFLYFVLFLTSYGKAQNLNIDSALISFTYDINLDSLEGLLPQKSDDTLKANILGVLSWRYSFNQAEKALFYGQKGIELSRKLGYRKGIAFCTKTYAFGLWELGNYNTSLEFALDALHQSEELNDNTGIAFSYFILANIYRDFGDYERALINIYKGTKLSKNSDHLLRTGYAITGSIYELQNRLDFAEYFVQKARELDVKIAQGRWGWIYTLIGNIERKKGNYRIALTYYQKGLPLIIENKASKDIVDIYNSFAKFYKETGNIDSCIFYAREVLQKYSSVSYQKGALEATNTLAEAYKIKNKADSTLNYFELSAALNNKLFNQAKERDVQNIAFKEQLRQDEMIRERATFRNKIKMYAFLAGGIIFMVIAFLLWKNNQQRQRAYALLQKQKQETDTQKVKVEQALAELKSTQAQLIQSEKMASLGELTAGIAHEIQNPLNFVNNFSEVNKELIAEMKGEIEKGNIEEVKVIADDIESNEEKINHHGKRADAIVKGMLQHSRTSSGQKELTDINALADEYLRLAYHGLRAKDKSFNAKFESDFDASLPKINVVQQEIGRAILNLINNAFYAVSERQKENIPGYEATVTISTRVRSSPLGDGRNSVEIRVKDNGNGIPKRMMDKIFQPFFTTKPAGQGTGLGLSLSYDIIKAHGGELKVETLPAEAAAQAGKEGEGSEFIIQLPIA